MKKYFIILFISVPTLLLCCTANSVEKQENVTLQSDFAVIIPKNSETLEISLAKSIVEYVKHKTGVEIPIVKDSDKSGGQTEILLGKTGRDDSFAVYSDLKDKMYKVTRMQSGNIVVAGADIYCLVHAVDQFIANGFETFEADSLFVPDSLDLHGILNLSDWEKQGASINHHMRTAMNNTVFGQSKTSNLKEISNLRMIMQLSGEYSLNRTRSQYDVSVSDLGSMCMHNGKLYFFFGDTYGGENSGLNLRSNVVAYTTDFDYTNGILFDGFLTDSEGKAAFVTQGDFGTNEKANVDNRYEYTKIPTGVLSLNGSLYMSYMSVAWWAENDDWFCNYGGIMKSEDDGLNWIKLDAQWPGGSKFCQMYPSLNTADGYIYVVGITGGRQGSMRMMRVQKDQYEVFDAYEYLIGYDGQKNAVWKSGNEGLYAEFPLINEKVWEPCVIYSDYLGEWIVSYKDANGIQLFTSKRVEGPYELSASIPYKHDIAGYYAVYMHPVLSSNEGSKLALLMSFMYAPGGGYKKIWQTSLMEITLVKK